MIRNSTHEGIYFADIPLTFKAISYTGHKFSHWEYSSGESGTKIITDPVIEMTPLRDFSLVAHFEISERTDPVVIINEINYHSRDDPDPGDWIELMNTTREVIDLTGWTFSDEKDDHVFFFPAGQEIAPYSYLVLTEDITAFRAVFPAVDPVLGDLGFGLSNGGEVLRLFGTGRQLIDLVAYDDAPPWPAGADGTGATLELTDPTLDNNQAEHWKESFEYGTPGKQNFSNAIKHNSLSQNYPNPFHSTTQFSFSIAEPGHVTIRIHDMYGRHISSLVNEAREKSTYQITWDASTYPAGLYLYSMFYNNKHVATKRLMIIR